MRRFLDFLAFILIVLSSGAIFLLMKAGGANNQGIADATTSDPFNFIPIFWKIAVVLTFSFIFLTTKFRYFSFDLRWLALITLGLASTFWAEFLKPGIDSALLLALSYTFVNLHVRLCGWHRVLDVLSTVFLFFLFLSVAAIFLLPSYGISVGDHEGKWQGIFTHKNMLGNFTSMNYLFFLWYSTIKNSKLTKVGILLSVLLTIGSDCTTGLCNIVISTLLFIQFRISLTRELLFKNRHAILALLLMVCVFIFYISLDDNQINIGEKDTTFSDRNRIWEYLISQIQTAPWFGHGMGQIGAKILDNEEEFQSNVGFVVGTAHNGFLETTHELGLVGLTMILIILIWPLRLSYNGPEFEFYFLYLWFFVILNMFESRVLGFNIFFITLMYVIKLTQSMTIKRSFKQQKHQ